MQVEISQELAVSADVVWKVFGEGFADIADWAKVILESELDRPLELGAVRTCVLKGGPVTEELTHFDRGSRSLTYVVRSGLPGMMKSAQNAWTIEAVGEGRTRVTSRVTAELAWWAVLMTPVAKNQLGATMRAMMTQLEAAALASAEAA